MLSVTGGKWCGKKIETTPRSVTRYTTQMARKALFDIIDAEGSNFLDIFSGSGIVGLEALSRGARMVVSVDSSRIACSTIRKNIDSICPNCDNFMLICRDFRRAIPFLTSRDMDFDYIFADPPFYRGYMDVFLNTVERNVHLLTPEGTLILESSVVESEQVRRALNPDIFELKDERIYGNVKFAFICLKK